MLNLLPLRQWQQCIKKAAQQVRVLSKDLFKGQVILWVQIPHTQKYKKKGGWVPK
jgi:hypothetical protein